MENCLFCKNLKEKENWVVSESPNFFSVFDENPVNKGHMMIITKEHIESFFDLDGEKGKELIEFIKKLKDYLDEKFNPEGYNLGVNDKEAGGQTIFHLHIHLIPRHKGDVENPIGGVRNIISGKGDYTKN
ncbi:MAG: HIT family protein [Nanoarchaeota archaeon]